MTNEEIAAELGRFINTHEARIVVTNWPFVEGVKRIELLDENFCGGNEPFFVDDYQGRKDEYLRIVAERLIVTYAKARYLK